MRRRRRLMGSPSLRRWVPSSAGVRARARIVSARVAEPSADDLERPVSPRVPDRSAPLHRAVVLARGVLSANATGPDRAGEHPPSDPRAVVPRSSTPPRASGSTRPRLEHGRADQREDRGSVADNVSSHGPGRRATAPSDPCASSEPANAAMHRRVRRRRRCHPAPERQLRALHRARSGDPSKATANLDADPMAARGARSRDRRGAWMNAARAATCAGARRRRRRRVSTSTVRPPRGPRSSSGPMRHGPDPVSEPHVGTSRRSRRASAWLPRAMRRTSAEPTRRDAAGPPTARSATRPDRPRSSPQPHPTASPALVGRVQRGDELPEGHSRRHSPGGARDGSFARPRGRRPDPPGSRRRALVAPAARSRCRPRNASGTGRPTS